jgi:hypothetical protein
MLRIFFAAVHWYIVHEPAVMVMTESGMGYVPDVALNTESHLVIFVTSDNLVESRADEDWEENERKAMVARIARITITTISSTRVKALEVFSWEFLVFREIFDITLTIKI